jgi:hypothetical protein
MPDEAGFDIGGQSSQTYADYGIPRGPPRYTEYEVEEVE